MGVQPKKEERTVSQVRLSLGRPCEIIERLSEVVYRVEIPPRGRRVTLHRDRLAPYRGNAHDPHGTPTLTQQRQCVTSSRNAPTNSRPNSPLCPVPSPPQRVNCRRPQRKRKPSSHLRDFVWHPSWRGTE